MESEIRVDFKKEGTLAEIRNNLPKSRVIRDALRGYSYIPINYSIAVVKSNEDLLKAWLYQLNLEDPLWMVKSPPIFRFFDDVATCEGHTMVNQFYFREYIYEHTKNKISFTQSEIAELQKRELGFYDDMLKQGIEILETTPIKISFNCPIQLYRKIMHNIQSGKFVHKTDAILYSLRKSYNVN